MRVRHWQVPILVAIVLSAPDIDRTNAYGVNHRGPTGEPSLFFGDRTLPLGASPLRLMEPVASPPSNPPQSSLSLLEDCLPDDAAWSTDLGFPGVDGAIYASCTFRGELIIGGYFTQVAGVSASCLARWDGSQWQPFGAGAGFSGYPGDDRPAVLTLLVLDDMLFVGGHFSALDGVSCTNLGQWDGTEWRPIYQISGYHTSAVWDLIPWESGILVGGDFAEVGYSAAAGLAFFDGHTLSAYPPGQAPFNYPQAHVRALARYQGDLIVAGALAGLVGPSQNQALETIARWDGETWSALGEGIESNPFTEPVWDLAADDSTLYAAGQLQSAGGEPIQWLAAWNGTDWQAVGGGLDGEALYLSRDDRGLLVGGCFTTAGNQPAAGIARWNGIEWLDAGYPAVSNGCVLTIISGDWPFVGGVWESSTDPLILNAAFVADDAWVPLGGRFGFNDRVYSFGTWDGQLVAGGLFQFAGVKPLNRIAVWNGQDWNPIGPGFDRRYAYSGVRAIQEYQGQLYAGGDFYSSNGVDVEGLARWDGESWMNLNLGPETSVWGSIVNDLCVHDSLLVAGGRFSRAAGLAVGNIAAWNGSSWTGFSTGMNYEVTSVIDFHGQLVAAGSFMIAGGVDANRIARWNGSAWEPMGNGFNETVQDLAILDDQLVAAGNFTASGSAPVNHVAVWDGVTWSQLGSGLDGGVLTLAACDGGLFAGGYFRTGQGMALDRLAFWNGSLWESVQGGTDGTVLDMIDMGELWIGGDFLRAGSTASSYVARIDRGVPVEPLVLEARWAEGVATIQWRVPPEMASSTYELYRGHPSATGVSIGTGSLAAGTTTAFDPDAPATGVEYWLRVVLRSGSIRSFGPAQLAPRPTGAINARALPNPFTSSTRIQVEGTTLDGAEIFDLQGRLVRSIDGFRATALHWDGRDRAGRLVGSGIYLVRLSLPTGMKSIRVIKQD